jgi:hypothetical protein
MRKPALRLLKNVRYLSRGVAIDDVFDKNQAASMEKAFGKNPINVQGIWTSDNVFSRIWPFQFKGHRFFVIVHHVNVMLVETASRHESEGMTRASKEFIQALRDALVPV